MKGIILNSSFFNLNSCSYDYYAFKTTNSTKLKTDDTFFYSFRSVSRLQKISKKNTFNNTKEISEYLFSDKLNYSNTNLELISG